MEGEMDKVKKVGTVVIVVGVLASISSLLAFIMTIVATVRIVAGIKGGKSGTDMSIAVSMIAATWALQGMPVVNLAMAIALLVLSGKL